MNLGKSRLMQQKREGARSVFRDAVKIVRTKLGYDDANVAEVQSQIGYLFFEAGDFSAALHAFADALAVHRANENKLAQAMTLCNIGSTHLEQKSFDPAIECFLEALQVCFMLNHLMCTKELSHFANRSRHHSVATRNCRRLSS